MSIKLNDFKNKLKRAFDDAVKEIESRQNMQQIGNNIANDIKKRTQLGYGARSNGGPKEKLKPLSDSYVQQRRGKLGFWTNKDGKKVPINDKKYLKQNKPKLSSKTSPKKSNLTRTGRMIRSIGALFTGSGKITIGFNSNRSAKIAAFVSKMRPFFYLTRQEEKRAQRDIKKRLEDILKRNIRKNF